MIDSSLSAPARDGQNPCRSRVVIMTSPAKDWPTLAHYPSLGLFVAARLEILPSHSVTRRKHNLIQTWLSEDGKRNMLWTGTKVECSTTVTRDFQAGSAQDAPHIAVSVY